jgi:hypothetical protein
MIFLVITGFLFPLLLQLVFYWLTYNALNERKIAIRKNILLREKSVKIKSPRQLVQNSPKAYDSIINQEYKLTKTVLICVLFFCLSWVAYFLFVVILLKLTSF